MKSIYKCNFKFVELRKSALEREVNMSRIHAGECEHMDMEWYGVDRQGNVAVFCSGGVGNLPEFVCENHERADELIDYFEMLEKMTSSVLMFPQSKGAEQCARDFSDKGLYYFDASDGTKPGICTFHKYYTKQSCPQLPLKYEQLPEKIREILKHNFMEIEDFYSPRPYR